MPNQFLIEKSWSNEGCHCFFFPFEGRYVHEGMSVLIAYRISKITPITFSIAMNDYGFELLSDRDIPITEALEKDIFSEENLVHDIMGSVNNAELAKRRFRGISQIAGLVFAGFPGNKKKGKHLQMSSGLFFDVFMEYEPGHLLIQQAYDEVLSTQLDEARLRVALQRIQRQFVIIKEINRFSPFALPIFVDRLRQRLSSEKLTDRIEIMQRQLEASLIVVLLMTVTILNHIFNPLPERAIHWIDTNTLMVTDLHLGKSGHFRKSGIPAPHQINQTNNRRLDSLVNRVQPDRLLILGDLFHSDVNREWFQFEEWRKQHNQLDVTLITGNHDTLHSSFYSAADLKIHHVLLLECRSIAAYIESCIGGLLRLVMY